MKINEIQRLSALNQYKNESASKQGNAVSRKKQRDELSISSEAKRLLGAQEVRSQDRAEKIEALRRSVASGTYHVDAGKVAEKLLPYLL